MKQQNNFFAILDNKDKFLQIDKSGMIQLVDSFPDMAQAVLDSKESLNISRCNKFENIVIAGMGGSAISGDILACLLQDKIKIPIFVIRNYFLPKFAGSNTLVITISYSGNTEETLSIFKEARQANAKIIAISSGGKLQKKTEAEGIPFIKVLGELPPRAALPLLFFTLVKIIYNLNIFPQLNQDAKEAVEILRKKREQFCIESSYKNNDAKKIAASLRDSIPIVLGSAFQTDAACMRWKTQFNENSKTTSLVNIFPEMNHNELVNLAYLKKRKHNFMLIILRDKNENERIKFRIEATKKILSKAFPKVYEYFSEGHSHMARIMSLIYLGDFVTTYLAVLRGIDPTPVEPIDVLKKELS